MKTRSITLQTQGMGPGRRFLRAFIAAVEGGPAVLCMIETCLPLPNGLNWPPLNARVARSRDCSP